MPRVAKKYTNEIKNLAKKARVDPRTVLRWRAGKRTLPAIAELLARISARSGA